MALGRICTVGYPFKGNSFRRRAETYLEIANGAFHLILGVVTGDGGVGWGYDGIYQEEKQHLPARGVATRKRGAT